ncbi:MAG: 50S ribosomal protein L19 [Minisyncoccia bacterium]
MELKNIKISPVNMEERKGLDIRSGDTIRVWQKIQEGDKTRTQAFEGIVLAKKHGKEAGSMITVRKIIEGVGVERIFPLYSPSIDKVEILRRANVRRAKLYYIRTKAVKEIRRGMKSTLLEARKESNTDTSSKKAKKTEEKTEGKE